MPTDLPGLIKQPKTMQAMLQMEKFDLAVVRKAAV